jgi:hypothetical protein
MDQPTKGTINADLVTSFQRVSGIIVSRNRGLSELLNDSTTAIIELSKAFVSRLAAPGEIVSYTTAPIYLRKSSILLVALAAPEKPINERNVYSMFRTLQYRATLNVRNFEVTGIIESIGKIEFPALLAPGESFICVHRARAVMVGSQVTFEGEEILVNKTHIDLVSAVKVD